MAGTIVVDRLESDASYASSINIASPLVVANTVSFSQPVTVSNTFVVPAGTVSAPAITPTGDTNTGIYFPAADNIGFATGGTIRGRWTTDGLCFGSDTAAANALDDYEEGTFTPAFSATGVTLNNANQYGYYTKIGNRVVAQIYLRCLYVSGSHSNLTITGFPFTSATGSFIQHGAAIGYCDGWTSLTYSQIFSYLGSNTTTAAILNGDYQGGLQNLSSSKIGGGSGAYWIATYVYQTP